RRPNGIQMMADGVFQPLKRSVVKERSLDCEVAQRRRAEVVSIGGASRDLLRAEVLVMAGPVEDRVPEAHAEKRGQLRDANLAVLKVAEHLIAGAGGFVAGSAARVAKEQDGAPLLLGSQGRRVTPGEAVEW